LLLRAIHCDVVEFHASFALLEPPVTIQRRNAERSTTNRLLAKKTDYIGSWLG